MKVFFRRKSDGVLDYCKVSVSRGIGMVCFVDVGDIFRYYVLQV